MATDVIIREMQRLTALRIKKGIDLHRIAAQTCISTCYLEAIEAQQWNRLPEGIYRTNYLRQYIQAIDPERSGSFVLRALRAPEPPAPPAPTWWQRLAALFRNEN